MNKIIAVDIGGVIRTKNEHASIETDNYLEAPVVPGAKEGLAFLINQFGAENVHLVSRCRLSKQPRSLEWLEHTGIFALGILKENVHLCVGFKGKIAKLKELKGTSKIRTIMLIDDNERIIDAALCYGYVHFAFVFQNYKTYVAWDALTKKHWDSFMERWQERFMENN